VAAKEAAMKAVGTGWAGGVRWLDIEIGSPGGAVPRLTLGGAILAHASSRGIRETLVSLSHDGDYAVATVVATDGR
jgi:holo-[acyl-carrier protein] synthase